MAAGSEVTKGTWLVTGGCGFIGSEFIRQVIGRPDLSDVKIVNVDALSYAASPERLATVAGSPRYKFVKCNIAHAAEVKAAFEACGAGGPVAVVNFAEIAMINPNMMAESLAFARDANVIPAQLVVLTGGIKFPKISEGKIADDDIVLAMHFECAVMNRRPWPIGVDRRV